MVWDFVQNPHAVLFTTSGNGNMAGFLGIVRSFEINGRIV